MDPDAFSAASSWFKWDPRAPLLEGVVAPPLLPPPELGGLEELFESYGVRYFTVVKVYELGFTVDTLLDMRDEELDEMMNSLGQIFRWDLLYGERYGIKSAVRAERRRLLSESFSQEIKEAAGNGGVCGGGPWQMAVARGKNKQRMRKNSKGRSRLGGSTKKVSDDDDDDDTDAAEDDDCSGGGGRQREHPFVVTEPGEVARGKKNGLDYLFHLYELCREFLIQVQHIAKERGEKCPTKRFDIDGDSLQGSVHLGLIGLSKIQIAVSTKARQLMYGFLSPAQIITTYVTNQVFRYAKDVGASCINKPKMRHYVHCYALHCLDEVASNALRRAFKERGENVGAWRQACYRPLVAIAAKQGWDIDAIFDAHPRLAIWYVPTKLRQLCHADRSNGGGLGSPFSASA